MSGRFPKAKPFFAGALFFALFANAIYVANLLLSPPASTPIPAPTAPLAADETDLESDSSGGSDAAQAPSDPLTWLALRDSPPAFCLAWSGFGSGMRGFESAKAIAFSSSLRDRHWPLPGAEGALGWEIRLASSKKPFAERAALLREIGHPIIEITPGGEAVVSRFPTESQARQRLSEIFAAGGEGLSIVSPSGPRSDTIILLPQGAAEIDFVKNLPRRIRGSSLSEAICPEEAFQGKVSE